MSCFSCDLDHTTFTFHNNVIINQQPTDKFHSTFFLVQYAISLRNVSNLCFIRSLISDSAELNSCNGEQHTFSLKYTHSYFLLLSFHVLSCFASQLQSWFQKILDIACLEVLYFFRTKRTSILRPQNRLKHLICI